MQFLEYYAHSSVLTNILPRLDPVTWNITPLLLYFGDDRTLLWLILLWHNQQSSNHWATNLIPSQDLIQVVNWSTTILNALGQVRGKGFTLNREWCCLLFRQYSVQADVGLYWHCLHTSLDEDNRSQGMT